MKLIIYLAAFLIIIIAPFAAQAENEVEPKIGFELRAEPPNPHWEKGYCLSCHSVDPKKSAKKFKLGGDIEKVCKSCHGNISNKTAIHAVGAVPSRKVWARMPVEFTLSRQGKVTCITCHKLPYQCLEEENHRKKKNPSFLKGAPYPVKTDFCYQCHQKEEHTRLNPHDQINDEGELLTEKCSFCHRGLPNPKKDKGINSVEFVTKRLRDLCQRCHKDRAHPGGAFIDFDHLVNPPAKVRFWMRLAEERHDIDLPLDPGNKQIFCGTCHNPHERGVLRGKYGRGADNNRRLKLGFGFQMCSACHGENAGVSIQ